jgi:PLP dependent protein
MIEEKIAAIRQQLVAATPQGAAPPRLIAVSKLKPASAVLAAVAAGQRDFGENYVQEAVAKQAEVRGVLGALDDLRWHLIGHLQSNKAKLAAQHFDYVHTVDRIGLARELSKHRPAELPALKVLLQVNIDAAASKQGCLPEQAEQLARAVQALPRLELVGLMAIPDLANAASAFQAMQTLRTELESRGLKLPELSMGMSDDFPAAIRAGATMIRIGSAIFGSRA